MYSEWHALQAQLHREASRLSFQKTFDLMRSGREALFPFPDPAALLDRLHRPEGDPETKNRILRALVIIAQGCGREAKVAQILLHLALWPGLDAIHGRRRRHFCDDPAGLATELSSGLSIGIAQLRLDRVNRIAATLLRNLERDLMNLLKARWQESAQHLPIELAGTIERPAAEPHGSLFGLSPGADPVEAVSKIGTQLREIIGDDADLVVDIALRDVPQREAVAARGMAYEAGRKRYQRSLARLRSHLAA